MITTITILVLFSYLLGSVPTGYMIAKHVMGIDIRQHGSGNPGAANVYRTVGKWAGISTFLIDGLKGFIPVCLARHFCPDNYWVAIACGVIAILGHMWTIYLNSAAERGSHLCGRICRPTAYSYRNCVCLVCGVRSVMGPHFHWFYLRLRGFACMQFSYRQSSAVR